MMEMIVMKNTWTWDRRTMDHLFNQSAKIMYYIYKQSCKATAAFPISIENYWASLCLQAEMKIKTSAWPINKTFT